MKEERFCYPLIWMKRSNFIQLLFIRMEKYFLWKLEKRKILEKDFQHSDLCTDRRTLMQLIKVHLLMMLMQSTIGNHQSLLKVKKNRKNYKAGLCRNGTFEGALLKIYFGHVTLSQVDLLRKLACCPNYNASVEGACFCLNYGWILERLFLNREIRNCMLFT